jgi:LemA protein
MNREGLKMGFLGTLLVIVAIVVIAVIAVVRWVISGQNNLVHTDELCGNALSQIGVQQASRWDALAALAELTRGYSEQEYKTLMDVVAARKGITPQSTPEQVDQQEAMLRQAVVQMNSLTEAYPDLKSNTMYLQTMNSVNSYEDKVRMSRMVYNDSVTKYNRLVRSMPGSFVAGSMGFTVRGYLQDDPGKAGMPSMNPQAAAPVAPQQPEQPQQPPQ